MSDDTIRERIMGWRGVATTETHIPSSRRIEALDRILELDRELHAPGPTERRVALVAQMAATLAAGDSTPSSQAQHLVGEYGNWYVDAALKLVLHAERAVAAENARGVGR